MSTKDKKVYLLYKNRISPRYPFEPELVDIFSSKEVAEEIAKKKNSYTPLGRHTTTPSNPRTSSSWRNPC